MRSFVTFSVAAAALCIQAGCFWSGKKKPAPAPPQTQTRPQRSPVRTKSKASQAPKPVRQPVAPAPQPAPAPGPAAPSLAPVISEEERRRLGESVESHLNAARQQLASMEKATLTAEQAEQLRAIRSFMTRAANVKASDPVLAEQLAYRAQVLARSLAGNVR